MNNTGLYASLCSRTIWVVVNSIGIVAWARSLGGVTFTLVILPVLRHGPGAYKDSLDQVCVYSILPVFTFIAPYASMYSSTRHAVLCVMQAFVQKLAVCLLEVDGDPNSPMVEQMNNWTAEATCFVRHLLH